MVRRKYVYTIIDITIFSVFISIILLTITGNLMLAVVEGRSMEPLFQTGDIVIVVKTDPKHLKPGDIIVYRKYDNTFIIHRIVKVEVVGSELIIVTKGDNNAYYDPPITYKQVVGKVLTLYGMPLKIPTLGIVSIWLKSIIQH